MVKLELSEDEASLIANLCYRAIRADVDTQRVLAEDSEIYQIKNEEIERCTALNEKINALLRQK